MIEHTLRRAGRLIPPERVLVVATASHRQHVFSCLDGSPPGTVLLQPAGHDTCPGILLPLVHILHRDPNALVTIFPSDHFIRPGRRFMGAVAEAAEYLTDHRDESGVLLEVEPTYAETDYGWIEPGTPVGQVGRSTIHRVNRWAILARCPHKLLVLPVRKVLWSDWGRMERILATLSQLRIQAPALAREGACFKATVITAGTL
jgi:mannose-1-phosphate guanylyltransferase